MNWLEEQIYYKGFRCKFHPFLGFPYLFTHPICVSFEFVEKDNDKWFFSSLGRSSSYNNALPRMVPNFLHTFPIHLRSVFTLIFYVNIYRIVIDFLQICYSITLWCYLTRTIVSRISVQYQWDFMHGLSKLFILAIANIIYTIFRLTILDLAWFGVASDFFMVTLQYLKFQWKLQNQDWTAYVDFIIVSA